MGRRITQKILICSECESTPDDGEYLWEMSGEYICEPCINADECECENLGSQCDACDNEE